MTRRKADPEGRSATDAAASDAPESDAPESGAPESGAPESGAVTDAQERPAVKKSRRRRMRRPVPDLTVVDRVDVADDALATIIGLAAHEVPGVVGMAPASLSEGLRRILGVSQVDEGVEVERGDDGGVTRIVLHVVVAYGVNIPAVAESVVERVRYAAKTFAGEAVSDVKVHVAGVSRG